MIDWHLKYFQCAKNRAWLDWDRKHTIAGIPVRIDPSMPDGEIRFDPNRFSYPVLTMTHGRVHLMDDVLLYREPEGMDA